MRKWPYLVAAFVIAGTALATSEAAAAQATTRKPISSGTYGRLAYVKNAVSLAVALPSAVAIGDVLGNGRDDLVVTTVNTDNKGGGTTVAVYPQLAHGRLGTPLTIKVPDRDDWTTRATITDLYANGKNEILLAEPDGIDVFSVSHGRLTYSRIPVSAQDVTVANFNGDKYPDLLIQGNQTNVFQVWTGSASHTFRLWRTLSFPHSYPYDAGTGMMVFAADFNHQSGRAGVAILTWTGFAVRVQTKPGLFGPEEDYKIAPIDGVTFNPASLVVGDITGDGYPDVAVDTLANSPWSGVEVFANARNGTFKAPAIYPTVDIPTGMAIADLTGNGRNDLVVAHTGWNAVGVLLQRSDGTFAPEALVPGFTPDYGPPAVGDLNGDGKPDIAFTAGEDGAGVAYQN